MFYGRATHAESLPIASKRLTLGGRDERAIAGADLVFIVAVWCEDFWKMSSISIMEK